MSIVFQGVNTRQKFSPRKIADVNFLHEKYDGKNAQRHTQITPPNLSTFPTRGNLDNLATEKAFGAKLLGLKGFTKQIPRLHSTGRSTRLALALRSTRGLDEA